VWLWDPINFEKDTLAEAIEREAKRHVYFQPPETFKMTYPCIVYERSGIDTWFADNKPYLHVKKYTVTVIDKNPDSRIPDSVSNLLRCSFNRHFVTENLYHDVFTLYY